MKLQDFEIIVQKRSALGIPQSPSVRGLKVKPVSEASDSYSMSTCERETSKKNKIKERRKKR